MKLRGEVSFDKRYFSKKLNSGYETSTEDKFTFIYKNNFWSGQSSVSGEGSDKLQTEEIRKNLPKIIADYEIHRMLDIPCGDFNWMRDLALNVDYIGADIVEEIVMNNKLKYSNDKRRFIKIDIIKSVLPNVDLIFCRDCLVHFSNEDIVKTIDNIKRSNSKYLLTTTFPECEVNEDIITGDWRIINLTKEPFNFPEPMLLVNENCTEGYGTYSDKSLGFWKISELSVNNF